jgi:formyl-CoA transferase
VAACDEVLVFSDLDVAGGKLAQSLGTRAYIGKSSSERRSRQQVELIDGAGLRSSSGRSGISSKRRADSFGIEPARDVTCGMRAGGVLDEDAAHGRSPLGVLDHPPIAAVAVPVVAKGNRTDHLAEARGVALGIADLLPSHAMLELCATSEASVYLGRGQSRLRAMSVPDPSPLDGCRVIELGNWISAPYAGRLLADFGAEVVKVDLPGVIDNNRTLGGLDPADPERSPGFVALARNKRAITLDIRTPRGRDLFLELVLRSDVVISNFRPGTLERYGLGFDELKRRNPHVVLLVISGYGQTGPRRDEPGLDRIAQAYAGVTYVTGDPAAPPAKCGVGIADYGAGLLGAFGVVLVLLARARDSAAKPSAQVVDVSLYDALLPMLGDMADRFERHGEIRERTGNYFPGVTPGNSFRGADGHWLLVSAAGDSLFARLAKCIGRAAWLDDPRLKTMRGRDENRAELEAAVAEWVGARSASDAVRMLEAAGVPVSAVNSIADVVSDPQVVARHGFTRLPDPALGKVVMASPVPRLSRTPGSIRATAPKLGEHNQLIFTDLLELGTGDLDALAAEKVI